MVMQALRGKRKDLANSAGMKMGLNIMCEKAQKTLGLDTSERVGTLPGGIAPLWTVEETAQFLKKSKRWIFYHLQLSPEEPGSIPHVRLGRTPRFCPEELREWTEMGCPPAGTIHRRRSPKKNGTAN